MGQPHRGGIAVFVRDDFRDKVVHKGDSPIDERSWHIVHCDFGPVLFCVCYRPPIRGEIESIRRFAIELDTYSQNTIAVLAVGDFHVHNQELLNVSNGNNAKGRELENICCHLMYAR